MTLKATATLMTRAGALLEVTAEAIRDGLVDRSEYPAILAHANHLKLAIDELIQAAQPGDSSLPFRTYVVSGGATLFLVETQHNPVQQITLAIGGRQ